MSKKETKKKKPKLRQKQSNKVVEKKRWIVQDLTKKIGPNCSIFREAQIKTSGIFGTVEIDKSPVLPLFQVLHIEMERTEIVPQNHSC